jgi:hypothetical protein
MAKGTYSDRGIQVTWLKKKRCLVACCFLLALATLLVMALRNSLGAPGVFKRYICDPIPKSVKHIRADRPWELSGHTYVMHFKISRDDLPCVFNSRGFKEVSKVMYSHGALDWRVGPSYGESYQLYPPGGPEPEWFRPNDWKDPKAYRFKERLANYRQHMQVLIYNEEVGEAYFVEYQEGY